LEKKETNPQPELHPRNPHRGQYDFQALQATYPPLEKYVLLTPNGQRSIDFGDPAAVLALNTALLKLHYKLTTWSIPAGYLCPPIPGRADYIHHVADLLGSKNAGKIPRGPKITCLDIGTGASLIYPIIGIRAYGWAFWATDIDEQALASAQKIQAANAFLQERLKIKKQHNSPHFFQGVIAEEDYIDLVVCNPPFYESAAQANRASTRKQRNLKQKTDPKRRNFGGQAHELWYPGGERAFISQMIQESTTYAKNVCWFTSLVSREDHLPKLNKELEKVRPTEVRTIDMGQGNKRSRILAWTFLSDKQQKAWAKYRWA